VSTHATNSPDLVTQCFAAPAGRPFTIVFHNLTVGLDGNGIWQNLSIYRSQADAVAVSPDGTEMAIRLASPIFSGEVVQGPGTIAYQVPPLPAGTYYLQSDYLPDRVYGTLVALEST
jgi:hypothetical protein